MVLPPKRELSKRVVRIVLIAMLNCLIVAPSAFAQNFGPWTPAESVDPQRQNVNSPANDGCPHEAPDGRMLFVASDRNPHVPDAVKDLDIWVAYRDSDEGQWLYAEPLPSPVNSAANDFCPTPLPANQLLFVSTRSNSCGTGPNANIYYTRLVMHPWPMWLTPVLLPCGVNSGGAEFSPSLVNDNGRTLLFFSSNRDTGTAAHKLYVSELQSDSMWTMPQQIAELNSGASDARPNVRKDGLEIVFDSNRAGSFDVYTSTRESLDAPWGLPVPLGPAVNDPVADETRPTLSRDGTTLYFGSTRANAALGGTGGDIYVSARSGPGILTSK